MHLAVSVIFLSDSSRAAYRVIGFDCLSVCLSVCSCVCAYSSFLIRICHGVSTTKLMIFAKFLADTPYCGNG